MVRIHVTQTLTKSRALQRRGRWTFSNSYIQDIRSKRILVSYPSPPRTVSAIGAGRPQQDLQGAGRPQGGLQGGRLIGSARCWAFDPLAQTQSRIESVILPARRLSTRVVLLENAMHAVPTLWVRAILYLTPALRREETIFIVKYIRIRHEYRKTVPTRCCKRIMRFDDPKTQLHVTVRDVKPSRASVY